MAQKAKCVRRLLNSVCIPCGDDLFLYPDRSRGWRKKPWCGLRRGRHKTMVVGVANGLGPAAGVDLGKEVVDVALHRHLRDIELGADLRVGASAGDGPEDIGLSGCE